MKIRIMGTLEECKEFKNLFLLNVNKENSYSVSDFYPNRGNNNLSPQKIFFRNFY